MNQNKQQNFIDRAIMIHGNKYDYSKAEYINANTKICIICLEHGEFLQTPSKHLRGRGCKKCAFNKISNEKRKTTEQFIEEAAQIHGDKYDYSKTEYVGKDNKVCIICPTHGEFWQNAKNHLKGIGCQKCNNKVIDTESFIEKARKVHGNKYDYSKAEYKNAKSDICIICPTHGEFWQNSHSHLNGSGCQQCGRNSQIKKRSLSYEEFICKARQVHGCKYDYSKVEYKNYNTDICIICPIHGEFWQSPRKHLSGHGCRKCAGNEVLTTNDFINKAMDVHGNKYKYLKSEYTTSSKKLVVTCQKHGDFLITPNNHLRGKGCPICKESSLERKVRIFLEDNNIEYFYQKKFDWLGVGRNSQKIDFYLPKHNIAIECQGEQHFKEVSFGCKDKNLVAKNFKRIKELDQNKFDKCILHGIKILYINYTDTEEEILLKLKTLQDIL